MRIGNSRGIRIPKPILEAAGLSGDVELELEEGRLIVRSVGGRRQNWEVDFATMAELEDDRPLDTEAVQTTWDEDEWEW